MTKKAFVLYLASEEHLVLMDLTGDYEAEVVKEFTIHDYNVHRASARS
ncbi:hypothetical protein [Candidatus Endomicrobiellum pyrsonymphae]